MKFPKLLNGPSAMGEGDARSIGYTGAPFLTIQGPTTRAQKKGGQVQVTVDDEKLRYWVTLAFVDPAVDRGALYFTSNFEMTKLILKGAGQSQKYSYGSFGIDGATTNLYAGDGYVLKSWSSSIDSASTTATYWPAIRRAVGGGVEELPALTVGKHQATTFLETARLQGMNRLDLSASTFVTGAVGVKSQGWNCGYAGLVRQPGADTSRYPIMWTMNTTSKAIQQRGVKVVDHRDHLPFMVFNAGRAGATYLHGVYEALIDYEDEPDPDHHRTWKEKVKPWISSSANHAASFTHTNADFLDDLLYMQTRDSTGESGSADPLYYDRTSYLNGQLKAMTEHAAFIHIGNSGGSPRSLLFIPNAYLEGRYGGPSPVKFQPAIFIGNAGSYTRLSWPADGWYVDQFGNPLPGSTNFVGFSKQRSMRSLCWAFGPGCAYIPAKVDGAWQWLVTYDYGSSWELKPVPEFLFSAYGGGMPGAVEKPYGQGEGGNGSIVFVSRRPGTRDVKLYRTNGLFSEWKMFASTRVSPSAGVFPISLGVEAEEIINFGDRPDAKSNVFPAFPGEFEPDDV